MLIKTRGVSLSLSIPFFVPLTLDVRSSSSLDGWMVPRSTSFDGEYTVFSDEAEFQSTLEAFLASPDGLSYTSSVIVEEDGTIRAASILSEYSGEINGDAAKQVREDWCDHPD